MISNFILSILCITTQLLQWDQQMHTHLYIYTNSFPKNCRLKRRPRKSYCISCTSLGLRLRQDCGPLLLGPYSLVNRNLWFLIYTILKIRWSPKEITKHEALICKIFHVYKDQDAVTLMIKYFIVFTCDLFSWVQLGSIPTLLPESDRHATFSLPTSAERTAFSVRPHIHFVTTVNRRAAGQAAH